MFEVSTPALNRLGKTLESNSVGFVLVLQLVEAATGAMEVFATDTNAVFENTKANKIGSNRCFGKLTFDGVNGEAERRQIIFNGRSGL